MRKGAAIAVMSFAFVLVLWGRGAIAVEFKNYDAPEEGTRPAKTAKPSAQPAEDAAADAQGGEPSADSDVQVPPDEPGDPVPTDAEGEQGPTGGPPEDTAEVPAQAEEQHQAAEAQSGDHAPAADDHAKPEKAAEAPAEKGWLEQLLPSVFGSSEEPAAKTAPAAENAHGDEKGPNVESGGYDAAAPASDHSSETASEAAEAPHGGEPASPSAESEGGQPGEADKGVHPAQAAAPAEKGFLESWLPSIFGSSDEKPAAAAHQDGAPSHGEAGIETAPADAEGGHGETAADGEHAPADAKVTDAHGDKAAAPHGAPPAEKGFLESMLPSVFGSSEPAPQAGHGADGKAAAHGEGAPAEGGHGATKDGAAPAEGGEHAAEAGAAEHGGGDGHGGEGGEAAAPPPPPLWPEKPAVAEDKQPYILVRALRVIQDRVAQGSAEAYDFQRKTMVSLSEEMRAMPHEVWDDVRNVRAAVYFVLTGGDPRVLTIVVGRPPSPHIDRKVVKGALAYGEGRLVDANSLLSKIVARDLDPALAGVVALIQGTLASKKDPQLAIKIFDEARLLSPGTLIEESALRQQILLVAKDGNLSRFDQLSSQYARRFGKSLFARNFRRQFFAGVARQNFKGANEWISRTEAELQRVPETERAGLYLAIAEEATKGGHIEIAKFAASNAAKLYPDGSREKSRAFLYEGAVRIATDEFETGVELLDKVDVARLGPQDAEMYNAALSVARELKKLPEVSEAAPQDAIPASVSRAQDALKDIDSLLNGVVQ